MILFPYISLPVGKSFRSRGVIPCTSPSNLWLSAVAFKQCPSHAALSPEIVVHRWSRSPRWHVGQSGLFQYYFSSHNLNDIHGILVHNSQSLQLDLIRSRVPLRMTLLRLLLSALHPGLVGCPATLVDASPFVWLICKHLATSWVHLHSSYTINALVELTELKYGITRGGHYITL